MNSRTFSVTAPESVERPPVAKALSQRWAISSTSESEIHEVEPCTKVMVAMMHNSRACTRGVFMFPDCIKLPA